MTDSGAEHGLGQEKGDNRSAMRTRASRCFGKKGGCEDGYLVPDRATDLADRKDKWVRSCVEKPQARVPNLREGHNHAIVEDLSSN
jgi:hypothetical protein